MSTILVRLELNIHRDLGPQPLKVHMICICLKQRQGNPMKDLIIFL